MRLVKSLSIIDLGKSLTSVLLTDNSMPMMAHRKGLSQLSTLNDGEDKLRNKRLIL